MNFRPLGDRVLIRRVEAVETTVGGIITPATAQKKETRGSIVAVGPGKKKDDGDRVLMDVQVGDTVLFGKYGGTEVQIDGEDLVLINEVDILGVIEG